MSVSLFSWAIRKENGKKTEVSRLATDFFGLNMDENVKGHRIFVFGDFNLDPEARIVSAVAGEIHLAPRPFEVLCFLVANHDRAVSRAELLDEFWEGHEVYDDALRKCVASIRKALKDTEKPSRLIETRYGGGYRFIADVSVATKNGNGSSNGSYGHRAAPSASSEISEVSPSKNFLREARLPILVVLSILLVASTVGFYVFVPRQSTTASAGNAVSRVSQIRSIAVMPLKNLTGDTSNEYFSDGITESIITELARAGELKVISRSSTFTLKGKEIDPREIGRQLGVDALLEGSVHRKGNLANVRVRLVDTRDGTILWTSNDFEREVTAAYDLQDAIACNVAAELRTELCGTFFNRKTKDGLAYQEYLKGRFEWNKRTADGIRKSIEHFNRALEIDPQYSLAYSGLSESYVQGIWHVPFNAKEILPKAEAASLKAVELDDSSPEAHTALASVYGLEWKWAKAEFELRRALEINPRFARGHHVQAFLYFVTGRSNEAVSAIEEARELDPLNMVISTDKAVILYGANRTDEAFAQWETTADLDPNFAAVVRTPG